MALWELWEAWERWELSEAWEGLVFGPTVQEVVDTLVDGRLDKAATLADAYNLSYFPCRIVAEAQLFATKYRK